MKCMFALLWVLFFLPGVMAGDYIVQDIQLTNSGTATVVMSNSNSWTVSDGQDAYVEQNIEFAGTSLAGDVYQDANNYVDLTTASPAPDNIVILQSITQIGVADVGSVDQDAYNYIIGDLGDYASVSQTIDQEAGAGEYVEQSAANTIDGDLGNYGTVTQSIYQVASGYYGIDQYGYSSPYGYGNYIGDINGDYSSVTQSIDQLAISDAGYVDQNVYDVGDKIGNINGWYGIATQNILQAGVAYSNVNQEAGDYGNEIDGVYGDSDTIAQGIEQLAISDNDYVDQYADNDANYIYEIDSDYNNVAQNIFQAALAHDYVYQEAIGGNNIDNSIQSDGSYVVQEITQVAVSDGYIDQSGTENHIYGISGDDNYVIQSILQAGLADDFVEQYGVYGNYIEYGIEGNGGYSDQETTQAAESENSYVYQDSPNWLAYTTVSANQAINQAAAAGDVKQDATSSSTFSSNHGNYIGYFSGDNLVLTQKIDQYAINIADITSSGTFQQLANYGNWIDGPSSGRNDNIKQSITQKFSTTPPDFSKVVQDSGNEIIDYAGLCEYLYTDQEILQKATCDNIEQYAYNDIEAGLSISGSINQEIDCDAVWVTSLCQDMANWAWITGTSDAYVDQKTDDITTPDGPLWNQANTIVDDITGTLYETQINVHNGNNVGNNFIV